MMDDGRCRQSQSGPLALCKCQGHFKALLPLSAALVKRLVVILQKVQQRSHVLRADRSRLAPAVTRVTTAVIDLGAADSVPLARSRECLDHPLG